MADQNHLLQRALEIALAAHKGVAGKDGRPYVLHPLRLLQKMDTAEEQMAAILHDVVEDSDVTLEELRSEGFPEEVLEAIRLLTHEDEISYDDYVRRLKPNRMARKVKLADLEDNSNIRRLSGLAEKDLQRLQKYHRAWLILKSE